MDAATQQGEKGSIAPELLAILCCPETKQPLRLLSSEDLKKLNMGISRGEIKNKAGQVVAEPIDGGLVRDDKKVVYAIRDQIPIMLIEEGLIVDLA